eukprot:1366320-Prymnesium_polylepis.1
MLLPGAHAGGASVRGVQGRGARVASGARPRAARWRRRITRRVARVGAVARACIARARGGRGEEGRRGET